MFPTTTWDGLSSSRPDIKDYKWPTQEDWTAMTRELQAVQDYLINSPTAPAGTDPLAVPLNDALTQVTKDIILAIGASAVASVDLGYNVPAGSLILSAAVNIESTITLATATKIGLGVAGDLDKYGIITGGTKNAKSTVAVTPAALAAAEDIKVYACDNAGDAAGTVQNGSVRVRLTLLTQAALPDAA